MFCPLITVLGPTAAGKSAVAMALARELDAEIISCDSMMVYRGMDIGTAKPTAADRDAIPHHLIDICDIHAPYDSKRFIADANEAAKRINGRNKTAILCGGTGLYAKAFLYGLSLLPGDEAVKHAVRERLQCEGAAALLAELAQVDPITAEKVAANPRRLARATEIVRITGKPIGTELFDNQPTSHVDQQFILMLDPKLNRERITSRTAAMLDAGWIEETRRLVAEGLLETPTASQALGYREITQYLESSAPDRRALLERLTIQTHRYAKRQRTWFRHQHPGATMVHLTDAMTAEDAAAVILKAVRQ